LVSSSIPSQQQQLSGIQALAAAAAATQKINTSSTVSTTGVKLIYIMVSVDKFEHNIGVLD
jgi:hypothetical protein